MVKAVAESPLKLSPRAEGQEVLVPMNEDINIYDGSSIEGSKEARSKNSWVEIFNMMDIAINNLTQQNKELKRTVNELGSKVNKVRTAPVFNNCISLKKVRHTRRNRQKKQAKVFATVKGTEVIKFHAVLEI